MTTWRISVREFPLLNVDVETEQYAKQAFEKVARPLLEQKLAEKFPDEPRRVLSFDDCNYRQVGQPRVTGVWA